MPMTTAQINQNPWPTSATTIRMVNALNLATFMELMMRLRPSECCVHRTNTEYWRRLAVQVPVTGPEHRTGPHTG